MRGSRLAARGSGRNVTKFMRVATATVAIAAVIAPAVAADAKKKPKDKPRATVVTTTTTTTAPAPPPIHYDGFGDSVVDVVPAVTKPAVAHIVYEGARNFIVESYSPAGGKIALLINEIGAYDGYRPLAFLPNGTVGQLSIESSGPWSIDITQYVSLGAPKSSENE